MSLEDVRQVSRDNPQLLQQNLVSTCFQHTAILIPRLRAAGHQAFHVCKSPGESQYVPPGFQPRTVKGLDGKEYPCSGVSPDAIWCDGTIVDTIASCNEHDRPIYHRNGDPNWSFDPNDGPRIIGIPVWNVVPPEHWRPNNPPLVDGAPIPPPVPPPPAPPQMPGREEIMHTGRWLDDFYKAPEGLQRPQGLSINGAPDWEGVGAWLFDVYLQARIVGQSPDAARNAVIAAIQQTDEWRGKHR